MVAKIRTKLSRDVVDIFRLLIFNVDISRLNVDLENIYFQQLNFSFVFLRWLKMACIYLKNMLHDLML